MRPLAKKISTEVILTHYNAISKQIQPRRWIAGDTGIGIRNYIVLDAYGIPLQRNKDNGFVSLIQDLPPTLQAWLDTQMPN